MQEADADGNGTWHRVTVFAGAVVLLMLPLILVYLALTFAPIGQNRSAVADPNTVSLISGLVWLHIPEEPRMLVFVMLVAALGGLLAPADWRVSPQRWTVRKSEASSTHRPTERRRTRPSVLRRLGEHMVYSVQGALLGAAFYLLVRAVVVAPGLSAQAISPLGMALLAAIVGLYSNQMIRELSRRLTDIIGPDAPVLRAIYRLEDRFDAAFSEPPLVLFNGVAFARVVDVLGRDLEPTNEPSETFTLTVEPGGIYKVIVGFLPEDKMHDTAGVAEPLKIPNGVVAPLVTFDCGLDSDALEVPYERQSVTFAPDEPSPTLLFNLVVPEASRKEAINLTLKDEPVSYDLYVEIAQKKRLLQSIAMKFELRGAINAG